MNGYLLGVLGTVLVCSLFTAIAPEGKTTGIIKGVARLACVLVIIAPVLVFFKTGSLAVLTGGKEEIFTNESVINGDGEYIQYYSEQRVRATEEAMKKELTEKYGVALSVSLQWTIEKEEFGGLYMADGIRIQRIEIDVSSETKEEVIEKMRQYVRENYCSEVLIE